MGNKKTLWITGITLLVCVAMLTGTTYAWFTDGVSNQGNRIQASNLDMQFFVADNLNAERNDLVGARDLAVDTDPIFNLNDWVPESTKTVYFKVMNIGYVTVDYYIDFVVTSGSLAPYIEIAATRAYGKRVDGFTYNPQYKKTFTAAEAADNPIEGQLLSDEYDIIEVTLTFKPPVGNLSGADLNFDVVLSAVQASATEGAVARVRNEAEFTSAIADSKVDTIIFLSDITSDITVSDVTVNRNVSIDLNGYYFSTGNFVMRDNGYGHAEFTNGTIECSSFTVDLPECIVRLIDVELIAGSNINFGGTFVIESNSTIVSDAITLTGTMDLGGTLNTNNLNGTCQINRRISGLINDRNDSNEVEIGENVNIPPIVFEVTTPAEFDAALLRLYDCDEIHLNSISYGTEGEPKEININAKGTKIIGDGNSTIYGLITVNADDVTIDKVNIVCVEIGSVSIAIKALSDSFTITNCVITIDTDNSDFNVGILLFPENIDGKIIKNNTFRRSQKPNDEKKAITMGIMFADTDFNSSPKTIDSLPVRFSDYLDALCSGNTFENCGYAIYTLYWASDLDWYAYVCAPESLIAVISVYGDKKINDSTIVITNNMELFNIGEDDLTIAAGTTIIINKDVEVKLGDKKWKINGTLIIYGTLSYNEDVGGLTGTSEVNGASIPNS